MRILEIRRLAARRAATLRSDRYVSGSDLDDSWFLRRFSRITAEVEARRDLAVPLKRVVLIALRQKPVSAVNGTRPLRTMRGMAPVAGYSPAYISKVASASGIRLGRVIDMALALRLLQLVTAEGCTLNEAGQRMGMGDASAVSSFIARATGARPSRLTVADVEFCFHRLSRMLAGR